MRRHVQGGAFQLDLSSRGQPPLAFYHRAAAHHRASSVRVVTSPDAANPVVAALINGSGALRGARLSSSASFKDDLHTLLCARALVLAHSSLSTLLRLSPNLRDAYYFERGGACPPAVAGSAPPGGPRLWCVNATREYSVARRWLGTAEQRREMLEFDGVSEPRLVGRYPDKLPVW